MRTQTTRTIAGRVNGDGTVASASGGGWTVTRTGTGLYNLRFPGCRLLSLVPASNTPYSLPIADTFVGDGCRVAQGNAGGTVTVDVAWSFVAVVAT